VTEPQKGDCPGKHRTDGHLIHAANFQPVGRSSTPHEIILTLSYAGSPSKVCQPLDHITNDRRIACRLTYLPFNHQRPSFFWSLNTMPRHVGAGTDCFWETPEDLISSIVSSPSPPQCPHNDLSFETL